MLILFYSFYSKWNDVYFYFWCIEREIRYLVVYCGKHLQMRFQVLSYLAIIMPFNQDKTYSDTFRKTNYFLYSPKWKQWCWKQTVETFFFFFFFFFHSFAFNSTFILLLFSFVEGSGATGSWIERSLSISSVVCIIKIAFAACFKLWLPSDQNKLQYCFIYFFNHYINKPICKIIHGLRWNWLNGSLSENIVDAR